jgi:hypothetical protein
MRVLWVQSKRFLRADVKSPLKVQDQESLRKRMAEGTLTAGHFPPSRSGVTTSRRFRALWLTAFVLLAFAQGLHVAGHFDGFPSMAPIEHHHSAEEHAHASVPCESSEAASGHGHWVDHCHSPAIMDERMFLGAPGSGPNGTMVRAIAPEAPVSEIDYPPQLS